jgi:hypothetical protein
MKYQTFKSTYVCDYLQIDLRPFEFHCLLLSRREQHGCECKTPFMDFPDDCPDAK